MQIEQTTESLAALGRELADGSQELLVAVGLLAGAALVGVAVHLILFRVFGRFAGKTTTRIDDAFLEHGRRPARFLVPLLFVFLVLPALRPRLGANATELLANGLTVLLGALFAWLAIAVVQVVEELLLVDVNLEAADNLRARKLYTQVKIAKRIAIFVVVLVATAAVLMSFEALREIGAGLLASAGLAGVILGFAAQKALANLIAGIQIALTQPIRIDDVVIVEGEWGRIEEITLTYVVVRIWDLRRLVVPISHFLDKPFQNWTRKSADLLATVFVYADYRVPVDAVRDALGRILEASPHWDGQVQRLHVTGASERAVELRALMSASNSGDAWELRCEVREKLLAHLQREHPDSLPRVRLEREPGERPGADGTTAPDQRESPPSE